MDREYAYDVFLSYAPADSAWARNELRPRLERAGLRVAESDDLFDPGAPLLDNYQHAVEQARRTIIVFSPAWLASDIHKFLLLLLRTMDPDAAKRRLLPLVVAPCVLPREITALRLETASFVDPAFQERQYRRVERAIRARIPPADYGPALDKRSRAYWEQWWLYYGPRVRRGALVVFLIWLLGSMLFQLPPFFQPRLVWHAFNVEPRAASALAYSGGTFFVGGLNPQLGCLDRDTGLWTGSEQGTRWESHAGALLCFQDGNFGKVLAAIEQFAVSPANPRRVYAATSNVGLLRSDDQGQHWQLTGTEGLGSPKLNSVAVDPERPDRVYVMAQGEGLYSSDDAGARWQRVNHPAEPPRAEPCLNGYTTNQASFQVQHGLRPLLALPNLLIAGTPDPALLHPGTMPGGLYAIREGNACWQQIESSDNRYAYRALAYAADAGREYLLALKIDYGDSRRPLYLARIDLSSSTFESRHLRLENDVDALTVVGARWFAADTVGSVVQGTLDPFEPLDSERLPRVLACGLLICDTALAAVPDSPYPVLLATPTHPFADGLGRVFAYTQGSWLEGLHPYGPGLPWAAPLW